jgi:hypothetical protein
MYGEIWGFFSRRFCYGGRLRDMGNWAYGIEKIYLSEEKVMDGWWWAGGT